MVNVGILIPIQPKKGKKKNQDTCVLQRKREEAVVSQLHDHIPSFDEILDKLEHGKRHGFCMFYSIVMSPIHGHH